MKPIGVMLVLGFVLVLMLCLVPVLWGFVRSIRRRARKLAMALGIVAAGILLFSAWAIYSVAPKGDRKIAQLELPDGRAFVVHHYRYGLVRVPGSPLLRA